MVITGSIKTNGLSGSITTKQASGGFIMPDVINGTSGTSGSNGTSGTSGTTPVLGSISMYDIWTGDTATYTGLTTNNNTIYYVL
jgi:hypothetical protein